MIKTIRERLAVCSWSLQPANPGQLLEALRATGIRRVQLALDPLREQPDTWGNVGPFLQQHGIQLVSGMFGTVGEDYTSLESIRRTGGLVPDSTWEENWENAQVNARLAHQLGLNLVTFHAGFLPHDPADPEFEKLQHRIRLVADVFAAEGIDLAFETGQETAETLRGFLEKLGRVSVGVNFDPANLLLYDQGRPLEALRALASWVKQCHVKDACRTQTPGTWGEEVPVGRGQVDWAEFFGILNTAQFSGPCCIEREAGRQRVADVRTAREFVEKLNV
ncbi:MAG TPA: sugar phosphate isomerase/epimerase family protein [Verrucomicrobiae bacterium]|nr:sugar phosphate isomerase/epimerase family protein [Verrucomicrobiae bacterium]